MIVFPAFTYRTKVPHAVGIYTRLKTKKLKKEETVDFSNFLDRFPEVDLPVTLGEEMHMTFSSENPPLQPMMIQQHLLRAEDRAPDEFTEFVPCFRIKETHSFHAVVYWRAGLMDYQYVMATFDKKGNFIDRRVLGGTHVAEGLITKSIPTIDEDWTIHVVSGQSKTDAAVYDPAASRAFELELLPDGLVVNV